MSNSFTLATASYPHNTRNLNDTPPSAPSPQPPQSSSANHGGDPAPPANSGGSNDMPSSPPTLSQPSSTNQEGGPAPAETGDSSNNTPSTPLPQAQNPQKTHETCRERYVLWCINLGRSQTTVAIIPVAAADKDKQVFNKLRQAYKGTRGWRAMASLHTLAEIDMSRYRTALPHTS